MATRRIETAFGAAEVPDAQCWQAHMPLPGFPGLRRFVLLDIERYRPLAWLQSLDDANLCFALAPPESYSLQYPGAPTESLFGHPAPEALLLVMTVFEHDTQGAMHARPHIRAPLCFDPQSMHFVQWILPSENACSHGPGREPQSPAPPLPTVAMAYAEQSY